MKWPESTTAVFALYSRLPCDNPYLYAKRSDENRGIRYCIMLWIQPKTATSPILYYRYKFILVVEKCFAVRIILFLSDASGRQ